MLGDRPFKTALNFGPRIAVYVARGGLMEDVTLNQTGYLTVTFGMTELPGLASAT